jgi:hypothetical protein
MVPLKDSAEGDFQFLSVSSRGPKWSFINMFKSQIVLCHVQKENIFFWMFLEYTSIRRLFIRYCKFKGAIRLSNISCLFHIFTLCWAFARIETVGTLVHTGLVQRDCALRAVRYAPILRHRGVS